MAEESIKVVGLKEFVKALKGVDGDFGKAMRKVHKTIADEVASATRASFSSRGGSAPKVAPTVKGLAQQNRAQVKIGGGSSVGGEVAMGNEFGSVAFKQFPAWRGGGPDAGYSLYPTLRRLRPRNEQRYLDAVEEATRGAFPD